MSNDQGYIYEEELAYGAVERALIARWLTIDWDIHSLLFELGVHLRISTDRCLEIHRKLKHELEVHVRYARPQIPAPAQIEYTLGSQRYVFTEHELGEMEKSAYEAVAVKPAFGLTQDPKTLRLLSKLRDVLRIPEEFYNQVLMRLERRVKTLRPRPREADDDEPPQPQLDLGNSPNADDDQDNPSFESEKYRCMIELSYGSFEEWERRKLTLLQPVERSCYKDDEEDEDEDDDGNSMNKSDEEWKPDGDA